jgi:hypothetical protein
MMWYSSFDVWYFLRRCQCQGRISSNGRTFSEFKSIWNWSWFIYVLSLLRLSGGTEEDHENTYVESRFLGRGPKLGESVSWSRFEASRVGALVEVRGQ